MKPPSTLVIIWCALMSVGIYNIILDYWPWILEDFEPGEFAGILFRLQIGFGAFVGFMYLLVRFLNWRNERWR